MDSDSMRSEIEGMRKALHRLQRTIGTWMIVIVVVWYIGLYAAYLWVAAQFEPPAPIVQTNPTKEA